jgi:hypothetical protein
MGYPPQGDPAHQSDGENHHGLGDGAGGHGAGGHRERREGFIVKPFKEEGILSAIDKLA